MQATEANFDGLVGPTHNYAGLSHGNLASLGSKGTVSNPRAAALEGLAKLKPAFKADGCVTAGNASQLSDGAAAGPCGIVATGMPAAGIGGM